LIERALRFVSDVNVRVGQMCRPDSTCFLARDPLASSQAQDYGAANGSISMLVEGKETRRRGQQRYAFGAQ